MASWFTEEVRRRLFDELTGIQYGERPDPFGWVRELPIGAAAGVA